ncbi:MAG: PilW family protein [Weeksellaceae bacterium]
MKKYQSKNGFTLIELVIFMGLFSILLLALTSMFTALTSAQIETQAYSAVQSDSQYLVNRLHYDISRADSITTPASAGTTATSLVLVIGGQTQTYSVSNGVLSLTTPTGTVRTHSPRTTISNLLFRRIGNTSGRHSLQITATITTTISQPGPAETTDILTTVGIRY